jgi:hypothetical protein
VPKRTDIKTVMLIGSGPIVIGQACEFDYSGTQGVKALKEEGYRVVLVNSNPATIMTDPEIADRTYVEPLTVEVLTTVIERERPDALLPTLGGQTALNLALELHKAGVLDAYGVKLIGAQVAAIEKAEDRLLFKEAMQKIGLAVPWSGYAHNMEEARAIHAQMVAETGTAFGIMTRSPFFVTTVVARQRISRMRPVVLSSILTQSPTSRSGSSWSASPAMMFPRVSCSARPMTAVVSTDAVKTLVTSTSERVSTTAPVMR